MTTPASLLYLLISNKNKSRILYIYLMYLMLDLLTIHFPGSLACKGLSVGVGVSGVGGVVLGGGEWCWGNRVGWR